MHGVLGIYSDRFADASGTIPPALMSIGRIRESLPPSAHRVGPVGDKKMSSAPWPQQGENRKGATCRVHHGLTVAGEVREARYGLSEVGVP
jgi:hypothetical protein